MLIIRRQQIEIFEAANFAQFEQEMLEHLRRELPAHYSGLGEAATREAIRYGIQKARTYGIRTHYGVKAYLKLLFVFGRDFDADPTLEWAGRVLNDPAVEDEAGRVVLLVNAALSYAQALTGLGVPAEV